MNVVARVRICSDRTENSLMVVNDSAYGRILAENPGIDFERIASVDGIGTYAVAEETLPDGKLKLHIKRVGREVAVTMAFDSWADGKGATVGFDRGGEVLEDGAFHSGTVFKGTVWLLDDEARELANAMADGFSPKFAVLPDDRKFQS